MNSPTATAHAAYFDDCCLDDSCPGHEGWVRCESFPADWDMVCDIRDASADFDHRARLLTRFGAAAIADPDNAIAFLTRRSA